MVQQIAITVLLLVWPDGKEAPERARSAAFEKRTCGFLKIVRIMGRVFSSSIMRTVCDCFGGGRPMACLSGSTAKFERPSATAVQKTNARPRKPPKMRSATAARRKNGVQISEKLMSGMNKSKAEFVHWSLIK